jgi:hypothetical protein
MNKKTAFTVMVKLLEKMDFLRENKGIDALFVHVDL